jgi:hypothetical protein
MDAFILANRIAQQQLFDIIADGAHYFDNVETGRIFLRAAVCRLLQNYESIDLTELITM